MQSIALLVDSWRLLKSRKLFWVTLGINLIVVVLYGSIGFTPKGVSILYGLTEFEAGVYAIGMPLARELYLSIFSNFIVTLWLGWIAAALAIISTTSIFPDFLGEGAIDMVLSKPISRVRVFLVKYAGSLLFVLLQVATFCVGAFLCIGFRLEEWSWGIFAAIPFVVLFFSYLYSVNVLVGVMTRSTIAALIATAIFWLVLWLCSSARVLTQEITFIQEIQATEAEATVARLDGELKELAADGQTSENSNDYERARGSLKTATETLSGERLDVELANRWLTGIKIATSVLPKHKETIDLVDRWVGRDPQRSLTEILMGGRPSPNPDWNERRRDTFRQRTAGTERSEEVLRSQSAWWIIGSSLIFEGAMLAIAAWLFARRDF